jgi:hypothetical protein
LQRFAAADKNDKYKKTPKSSAEGSHILSFLQLATLLEWGIVS